MPVRKVFRLLVWSASALALLVVVFGAFVRLSDAGLGCPDWPGCYGHVAVPQSETATMRALERFPGSVIETRKAWIEMIHRYLAGTLGILVASIAVLAWRFRVALRQSPWLPTALVLLICLQAAFGMWTVTMLLMPAIVTGHLIGGMTTLALLAWLAARQRAVTAPEERSASAAAASGPVAGRWAVAALIVLACQICLGGWVSTNYAGMACPDLPLCQGSAMPSMDVDHGFSLGRRLGETSDGSPLPAEALTAIHWAHRIWAIVTVTVLLIAGVMAWAVPWLRGAGLAVVLLALTQAALGIANVAYVLPLPLAVAHNAGAAMLLVMVVVLNFKVVSALRREM